MNGEMCYRLKYITCCVTTAASPVASDPVSHNSPIMSLLKSYHLLILHAGYSESEPFGHPASAESCQLAKVLRLQNY